MTNTEGLDAVPLPAYHIRSQEVREPSALDATLRTVAAKTSNRNKWPVPSRDVTADDFTGFDLSAQTWCRSDSVDVVTGADVAKRIHATGATEQFAVDAVLGSEVGSCLVPVKGEKWKRLT